MALRRSPLAHRGFPEAVLASVDRERDWAAIRRPTTNLKIDRFTQRVWVLARIQLADLRRREPPTSEARNVPRRQSRMRKMRLACDLARDNAQMLPRHTQIRSSIERGKEIERITLEHALPRQQLRRARRLDDIARSRHLDRRHVATPLVHHPQLVTELIEHAAHVGQRGPSHVSLVGTKPPHKSQRQQVTV